MGWWRGGGNNEGAKQEKYAWSVTKKGEHGGSIAMVKGEEKAGERKGGGEPWLVNSEDGEWGGERKKGRVGMHG